MELTYSEKNKDSGEEEPIMKIKESTNYATEEKTQTDG